MPRAREFDEAQVLDRALDVFWRRGYDGTALSELVEATGLQRQSLYNAFTDKHGLFQAVLARYTAHVGASLTPLDTESAGLAELRGYLSDVLERLRADGVGGCLIVKTALGPEVAHGDVRRAVDAGAELVRGCFARVLSRERQRGKLAASVMPAEGAAFLYAVLHGLSALLRTGGTPGQVEAAIDRAFASLAPAPGPGRGRRAGPRRNATPDRPHVRRRKKRGAVSP